MIIGSKEDICLKLEQSYRQHLRDGRYFDAISDLIPLVELRPYAITERCDLAGCYLIIGNFVRHFELIQTAYQHFRLNGLSNDTNRPFAALLKLGVGLEEIGQLDRAQMVYRKVNELNVMSDDDVDKSVKVKSQCLRISSELNHRVPEDLYKELNQFTDLNKDRDIDRLHALMIADFMTHNQESVIRRVGALLEKRKSIPSEHQNWLVFEVVFNSLRFGMGHVFKDVIIEVLNSIDYFSCADEYKVVWELFHIKMQLPPPASTRTLDSTCFRSMQKMARVRILDLALRIDHFNQDLWKRELAEALFQFELEAKKCVLKLLSMFDGSSVNSPGLQRNLKFSKTEKAILRRVLRHPKKTTTFDQASQDIYQCEADLKTIAKLKVVISRLNNKLFKLTGITKSLVYEKNVISLSEGIDMDMGVAV